MKAFKALLAVLAAASLAGCASATTGPPAAGSTAVTASQSPKASESSARQQILFDPCKSLPREVVMKAGYDPNNLEPSDFDGGSYKFLVCDLSSDMYSLGISSGNISVTEQQAQQKRDSPTKVVTPITVAGRSGFEARDPSRPNMCTLAFQASYGEVLLTRYQREKATDAGLDVCDGMQQTAVTIAAALPVGRRAPA
ncbi:DUF3558 domain-containing protein [Rhodococcus sp. D2-41]|uniref:DUF3558 domain-containing protein n=1 Tax=Speluncibacter jeojiensis TaxID=2710754 RepID=UPI0024107394|nr:DUF3558 domain-containing protein [Rhodococcus sp. D2-41]MDG3012617.1 DUF3558 domain-containing protein [Rhodococcus sp. D2-41]